MNILDSGNPYHIENIHLTGTANQLNGLYEIKGITVWKFPAGIKNEY